MKRLSIIVFKLYYKFKIYAIKEFKFKRRVKYLKDKFPDIKKNEKFLLDP